MGMLDNLNNMFQRNVQQKNTSEQPNQRQISNQSPNNNLNNNMTLDNNSNQQQQNGNEQENSNTPKNPLDNYSKIWDTPTVKDEDKAPVFKLDPKTVKDVSSSLNFMEGIDEATMAKIQSGDSNAIIQAMQHVGRQAYESAIQHGGTLTDNFVNARLTHEGKSFGSRVKQELTQSELKSVQNYNHPVIKAQLDIVSKQFASTHPDASPSEIAEMSKNYLKEIATALTTPEANPNAEQVTDWDKQLRK